MKPKEPESDCNQVKRRLCEFLKKREEELSSTHENLQFIAVNQEGYYYSDEGLQGVWYRSKDLQDADIKSFLTSDWITNETRWYLPENCRASWWSTAVSSHTLF